MEKKNNLVQNDSSLNIKRIKLIKNYEKIAAGEVIERPSSVVKELVENSIDANAKKIDIIIKNAGKDLIQVIDDGLGILPDDVEEAFKPHTSSKIESADDIFSLNTLGFRGEALHSIAIISKVEIMTKTRLYDYGIKCVIEDGKVIKKEKFGCADGTNIKVMNLFYNTPARLKFLKSDPIEMGHITDIVTRLILLNPKIHFKLISNGKTIINSPSTENYKNILFNLYGKEIVEKVVEIKYEDDEIKIWGFLGDPALSRNSYQFSSVFVNGRFVISPLINKAMDESYKNFIMTKKHPFFILFIELDKKKVDINVHPTKKIIKFENESNFYVKLEKILKEIVIKEFGYKKSIDLIKSSQISATFKEISDISKSITSKDVNIENYNINDISDYKSSKRIKDSEIDALNLLKNSTEESLTNSKLPKISSLEPIKKKVKLTQMYSILETPEKLNTKIPELPNLSDLIKQRDWIDTNGVFPKIKIPNEASQLKKLYFILEGEDGFYILDMHAAYERINYEKQLKLFKSGMISKQTLLIPVIFEVPLAEVEFVKQSLDKISKFGFEIDYFGSNSFSIRTIPAHIKEIYDESIIKDMCLEIINLGKQFSLEEEYDRVIKLIACRMSIKGGVEIDDPIKVIKLIQELAKCENPHHCAHGRPVLLFFSYNNIDSLFHRK